MGFGHRGGRTVEPVTSGIRVGKFEFYTGTMMY